jgi:poly(3-hydroxybutyrate) depolymerase
MKYILLVILLTFNFKTIAASNFFPNSKEEGNVLKKKFEYEDQEISYFIYYPKSTIKNSNNDFYIIFHGETSKAEDFLNKTRLYNNIKNENKGFIAFESTASDWFSHKRKNIKDKDFIKKLLIRLSKTRFRNFNIIGYSSGGSFVNDMLCKKELPEEMNNILTVNSSGKEIWIENCEVPNNLNYYSILGEDDDYYAYSNKENKNKKYKLPDEDFLETFNYFNLLRVKMNCSDKSIQTQIEKDISDNSYIENYIYSCSNKNKNNLQLFKGIKMGHNFPEVIDYSLEDFRGNTNLDIKIISILK